MRPKSQILRPSRYNKLYILHQTFCIHCSRMRIQVKQQITWHSSSSALDPYPKPRQTRRHQTNLTFTEHSKIYSTEAVGPPSYSLNITNPSFGVQGLRPGADNSSLRYCVTRMHDNYNATQRRQCREKQGPIKSVYLVQIQLFFRGPTGNNNTVPLQKTHLIRENRRFLFYCVFLEVMGNLPSFW